MGMSDYLYDIYVYIIHVILKRIFSEVFEVLNVYQIEILNKLSSRENRY